MSRRRYGHFIFLRPGGFCNDPQIAAAVRHLHVIHNIAHRDLKPENLLYDKKCEGIFAIVISFGKPFVMILK